MIKSTNNNKPLYIWDIRVAIIGFFLCVIISILFCVVYVLDNERMNFIGSVDEYKLHDNYTVIIDSVESSGKYYNIYGCALELGKDIAYVNNHFVLIDKHGQVKKISTVNVKRESATQYFNDGYNYDSCGLIGQVKKTDIIEGETYKIGVLIISNTDEKYLKISDYILTGGE